MSRVKVDITADKSGFDAAIKGVNRSFEDLKGLVAGAFTIEAIKSFTENTIEFAEQITNAAMRLNMTVEQLQVLKQAAKDNGVEFEKLESSLEKVSVAKERALRGDTKALSYFSQLGISKQDLKQNRSADLVFGKISAAVSSKNVESITEPLRKILGNSFGELMPLLKTNITEVSDKLQAMGAIMDTDTAVKLRVIGEQFKGLGTILITLLAPAIVSLVESMEQVISKFLHFSFDDKNKPKEADKKSSWKDIWTNTKGVGKGLLGSLDVVAGTVLPFTGLRDKGIDRMASAELDFQKTGFNGGIVDKLVDSMAKGGNPADKFDAMMDAQKEKIKNLTDQLKHGGDKPVTVPNTNNNQKGVRIYTDELNRTGNMIGASFQGIGNVASALDLSRQQLAVLQNQAEQSSQQTDILLDIRDNTEPGSDNWP